MQRESVASVLAVLVLLGCAGLAVAADGPTAAARAEVQQAQVDAVAAPYVAALEAAVNDVRQPVATVATAGREVAERMQALDIDGMRAPLGTGNAAFPGLQASLDALALARDSALENVDSGAVSSGIRDRLEQLVDATESTDRVDSSWRSLAARALVAETLVDSLANHDAAAFAATNAGRGSHWDDALTLLGKAGSSLTDAAAVRDQLQAGAASTPTLDNLLVRYAAYDAALTYLYTYMRDSGDRSTDEFAALNQTLERAQAALPEAPTVLSLIVDEAAGSTIDANLAAIEAAARDLGKAAQ